MIQYKITNLREVRERLGLSQRQLSAYVGVSSKTLAVIERKRKPVRGLTFFRILNGLKTTPSFDANALTYTVVNNDE